MTERRAPSLFPPGTPGWMRAVIMVAATAFVSSSGTYVVQDQATQAQHAEVRTDVRELRAKMISVETIVDERSAQTAEFRLEVRRSLEDLGAKIDALAALMAERRTRR